MSREFLQVSLFNSSGKSTGDIDLPVNIFGETPNMPVMHQAYVRQMANRRQGTASTKTRAEVAGGGRKPYRQKGTGNARHGSTREPEMRGGGVAMGPHPRSYRQSMPRKMRRLALRSALSVKAAERRVKVVEGFDWTAPSTRQMLQRLSLLGVENTALLVLPTANQTVQSSARNLPGIKVILAGNLNIYDLFTHDQLVIQRDALKVIEGCFSSMPFSAGAMEDESEETPSLLLPTRGKASKGGEK